MPLPLADHVLVVCHTGSERKLQASEYNARRAQCERAVAVLAGRGLPVRALRDVTPTMLEGLRGVLDDETFRRCAHVVREDVRVEGRSPRWDAGTSRWSGGSSPRATRRSATSTR